MKFVTLKERQDLSDQHSAIVKEIWSPVMRASEIAYKCWPKLNEYFPDYQIFALTENDDVIGFVNTIPIFWDDELHRLPDEGWDWLIQKGLSDFEKRLNPNYLGGLQVGIARKYQGHGYSKLIVEYAKKSAFDKGLNNFIIPIRPVLKSQYPLIEMTEYIGWKKDGKVFDPWIRTHLQRGAEILKVCNKSMTITASVELWEELSGLSIVGSGKYIIEGAASPIVVDVRNDIGTYYDENIWIVYRNEPTNLKE